MRCNMHTNAASFVAFTLVRGGSQPLRRVSLLGGSPRAMTAVVIGNVPVAWLNNERFLFASAEAIWIGDGEQGQERVLATPDPARNHIRYTFPAALPGNTHALITIFKRRLVRDSSEIGIVSISDGRGLVQGLGQADSCSRRRSHLARSWFGRFLQCRAERHRSVAHGGRTRR